MYPSEAADKFLLRLPEGMRERIRERAKANQRTMNAEVVFRLERDMSRYGDGAAEGATSPRLEHANHSNGDGDERGN